MLKYVYSQSQFIIIVFNCSIETRFNCYVYLILLFSLVQHTGNIEYKQEHYRATKSLILVQLLKCTVIF